MTRTASTEDGRVTRSGTRERASAKTRKRKSKKGSDLTEEERDFIANTNKRGRARASGRRGGKKISDAERPKKPRKSKKKDVEENDNDESVETDKEEGEVPDAESTDRLEDTGTGGDVNLKLSTLYEKKKLLNEKKKLAKKAEIDKETKKWKQKEDEKWEKYYNDKQRSQTTEMDGGPPALGQSVIADRRMSNETKTVVNEKGDQRSDPADPKRTDSPKLNTVAETGRGPPAVGESETEEERVITEPTAMDDVQDDDVKQQSEPRELECTDSQKLNTIAGKGGEHRESGGSETTAAVVVAHGGKSTDDTTHLPMEVEVSNKNEVDSPIVPVAAAEETSGNEKPLAVVPDVKPTLIPLGYRWIHSGLRTWAMDGDLRHPYVAIIMSRPYQKKVHLHLKCDQYKCFCNKWYTDIKWQDQGYTSTVTCDTIVPIDEFEYKGKKFEEYTNYKKKPLVCYKKLRVCTKAQDKDDDSAKKVDKVDDKDSAKLVNEKRELDKISRYTLHCRNLKDGWTDSRLGCALNSVLDILYILCDRDRKTYRRNMNYIGMDCVFRDIIKETNAIGGSSVEGKFGRVKEAPQFLRDGYNYDGMISVFALEKCLRRWFPMRKLVVFDISKTRKQVTLRDILAEVDHSSPILIQGVLNRDMQGKRTSHVRFIEVPKEKFLDDEYDEHFQSSIVLQDFAKCTVESKWEWDDGKQYYPPQHDHFPCFFSNGQRTEEDNRVIPRQIDDGWLDLDSRIGKKSNDSYVKRILRIWKIVDKSDDMIGQSLTASKNKIGSTSRKSTGEINVTLGGDHMVLPFCYKRKSSS